MTQSPGIRFLPRPGHEPALHDRLPARVPAEALRPGALLMPAPVNAHDHGYGIRTLDFGCVDDALEVWIPSLRLRPRTDPYLEALVAFSRLALTGIGATMHCHNSLNVDRLVEEAGAVIRAASEVGIRLALSCPLLDFDPWAYDGGPQRLRRFLSTEDWSVLAPSVPRYAPIARQIEAVLQVAAENDNPMIDVQFGPIGPQWCSNRLLETIAEVSALHSRRIHMHLLESPRQRRWLDRRFPQGVVRYLDEIGFLSPRLAVAHGVQLHEDELDLLAERGVQLVSNPSANLRLRSGVAPLPTMTRKGPEFAIGLDGTGFDDDQDLWRELRLAYLLHGGREVTRSLTAADLFDAAIWTGAKVLNMPAAEDYVVIDYAALIADSLFDDVDETEVLMARMSGAHAKGLIVAGREIMRDGQLIHIEFEAARRELLEQARGDLPRLQAERASALALARATRDFYTEWE
ncbi:amidohydrolase family protein [Rhizobium sp. LC145]|uniref:amidohydrolase family protein n=1 Tax=Rhizobium sp. LC145 TaxID=1120688 RepID=UPI00062A2459|nr:amidohydrolase family protein [Rhizobium sp. LC145]KKX32926.1 amidohydrolase [Rhizobium sp. LC145]TKT57340.1 amidohydrolase [Rhizobiaceae bacterium LC148]